MAHGGARPGAGRKRVHDEIQVRDLAIAAIVKVYGSEQKGFEHLLESKEPSLVKFVFEHGFGKPKENIQHSGDPDLPVIFKTDDRYSD